MTKEHVKFQNNWHKTVGIVNSTYMYYFKERKSRSTELRKAKYFAPPLFIEKAEGKNRKLAFSPIGIFEISFTEISIKLSFTFHMNRAYPENTNF